MHFLSSQEPNSVRCGNVLFFFLMKEIICFIKSDSALFCKPPFSCKNRTPLTSCWKATTSGVPSNTAISHSLAPPRLRRPGFRWPVPGLGAGQALDEPANRL